MPNKLTRFWLELKRRKVIHVIVVYASAAFVIIELVNNVYETLNLPGWTPAFTLILLSIGFPIAIIFSWIFDLTSEGLKKTQSVQSGGSDDNENRKTAPRITYNNSIAVLPFEDMSPNKDQEYFCEGIAEEIINSLTQVKRLKVIARTSAFAFKGKQMDIREIGNTLDVANVLEGSIRKDGDKIRITAQLIRVEDGYHLWSETYNREIEDIFSIQDEIALAIVEKLKMNILGEATGGILKRYTENTVAYIYYLKGLNYYQMMTPEGNQKAQEYYRKAIKEDPKYALAYLVLGNNHLHASLSGFIEPDQAVKYAREYTKKALEIDKTVPAGYATLALIKVFYNWDLEDSEEYFVKSVNLNPNTAWDRFFFSWYLILTGRIDEGIAESLYALEKDPFNIYIRSYIGLYYLLEGNTAECIKWQKSVIDLYPNGFMAFQHLGEAYEVKGMLEEAIESYEKAITLSNGSPKVETKLACVLHKTGRTDEARKKIEKLEKMKKGVSFYIPSAPLILYYLLTKDLDRAFYWLKKACDEHDFNLPFMMRSPLTEYRMPDDPRFNALFEETGLDRFLL